MRGQRALAQSVGRSSSASPPTGRAGWAFAFVALLAVGGQSGLTLVSRYRAGGGELRQHSPAAGVEPLDTGKATTLPTEVPSAVGPEPQYHRRQQQQQQRPEEEEAAVAEAEEEQKTCAKQLAHSDAALRRDRALAAATLQQLSDEKKARQQLRDDLAQTQLRLSAKEEVTSQLHEDLAGARAQLSSQSVTVEQLRADLSEAGARLSSAGKASDQLRGDLEVAQAQLLEEKKSGDQLRIDLAAAQAQRTALTAEVAALIAASSVAKQTACTHNAASKAVELAPVTLAVSSSSSSSSSSSVTQSRRCARAAAATDHGRAKGSWPKHAAAAAAVASAAAANIAAAVASSMDHHQQQQQQQQQQASDTRAARARAEADVDADSAAAARERELEERRGVVGQLCTRADDSPAQEKGETAGAHGLGAAEQDDADHVVVAMEAAFVDGTQQQQQQQQAQKSAGESHQKAEGGKEGEEVAPVAAAADAAENSRGKLQEQPAGLVDGHKAIGAIDGSSEEIGVAKNRSEPATDRWSSLQTRGSGGSGGDPTVKGLEMVERWVDVDGSIRAAWLYTAAAGANTIILSHVQCATFHALHPVHRPYLCRLLVVDIQAL
eukprot:COSAG01_NODE_3150_length_6507_cov_6.711142_7_plen_607_part_00